MSARLQQVIISDEARTGSGAAGDPVRSILQFWSTDGKLLGSIDSLGVKMLQESRDNLHTEFGKLQAQNADLHAKIQKLESDIEQWEKTGAAGVAAAASLRNQITEKEKTIGNQKSLLKNAIDQSILKDATIKSLKAASRKNGGAKGKRTKLRKGGSRGNDKKATAEGSRK